MNFLKRKYQISGGSILLFLLVFGYIIYAVTDIKTFLKLTGALLLVTLILYIQILADDHNIRWARIVSTIILLVILLGMIISFLQ